MSLLFMFLGSLHKTTHVKSNDKNNCQHYENSKLRAHFMGEFGCLNLKMRVMDLRKLLNWNII